MNVNGRRGLRLGVILLAVTVGSAAAARALASAQIGSGPVPSRQGPCFILQKQCRPPLPPAPTPRPTQR